MHFNLIFFVTICLWATGYAVVMNRCSLARAMARMGVPRRDLNIWTCLAYHGSQYNTAATSPIYADTSIYYGIFQISNRYWCQGAGPSYNACRVSCYVLLSDDITPSVRCALQIQRQQGFGAWRAWHLHCSGRLPSINNCF